VNHRARRRRRRRRHPLRTVALSAVALATCALAIAAAVLGSWAIGVVDDTPDIATLHPRPQPSVSAVYAADGSRLGFIAGDVLRVPLRGRGVPWQLRDATVAIEDRRFYDHGGIDVLGAARAAVENTVNGRTVQTFSDGQTAKVTDALEGVLDHGTAAGLGIGCPAAGKTGTTSSFTDAWFVGFTPVLSTSVWVGYPSETTSMSAVPGYGEVFGATIPAPIWQQYMEGAIGSACESFAAPSEPFVARPFDGAHQSAPGEETTTTTNSTTVRLVL